MDESALVWIAAAASGVAPPELVARCDVAALARVSAAGEGATGPLDRAARLLLAMLQERPFPDELNTRAVWLTAAFVLTDAGIAVNATGADVAEFLGTIGDRTDAGTVVVGLDQLVAGRCPRTAWLCPTCGREVYHRERAAGRMLSVGGTPFELRARCAFEHRVHDRGGRPLARSDAAPPWWCPVLARDAAGSMLVLAGDDPVVLRHRSDDGDRFEVVRVGQPAPEDLVGDWSRFVDAGSVVGVVDASVVRLDRRGRSLDWAHLGGRLSTLIASS